MLARTHSAAGVSGLERLLVVALAQVVLRAETIQSCQQHTTMSLLVRPGDARFRRG